MKLLLTSAGLTNASLTDALGQLLEKPIAGTKLAFVPTAANVEAGEKDWLIDDLNNCRKAGFVVDIVDISAVTQDCWLPRLEDAEVLCFGGGNTFHLMYWMQKSGLVGLLPELLKKRVYMGISAGSCVTGQTIYNPVQNLFDEQYEVEVKKGLGLVDFQFIPHLNSPYFKNITKEKLEQAAQEMTESVYALDDQSALIVDDTSVEIVSEGKWYKLNLKPQSPHSAE